MLQKASHSKGGLRQICPEKNLVKILKLRFLSEAVLILQMECDKNFNTASLTFISKNILDLQCLLNAIRNTNLVEYGVERPS